MARMPSFLKVATTGFSSFVNCMWCTVETECELPCLGLPSELKEFLMLWVDGYRQVSVFEIEFGHPVPR